MQPGAKTLFLIVLLLALPIASYFLVFQKLSEEIAAKEQDTRQKQDQLNDLKIALASGKELEDDIQKLGQVINLLKAKLPQEKDMDSVIREVWETAERHCLNTKSIRTKKVIQSANYSEQPIQMSFVGSFSPGVFDFLRDIEQISRLTRVSDLKIVADDKVSGQVSADITVTIYFEASQKVAVAQ